MENLDVISNGMDDESLEKYRDGLKKLYEYYKSENKKMNSIFTKLHLNRKELRVESSVKLAKMSMWQDIFKTKRCISLDFSISHAEYLKRKNALKYPIIRIRNSINMYGDLLIKIFRDMQSAERYNNCKEESADAISTHEIDSLKMNIIMYNSELKKIENSNNYSWLKDNNLNADVLVWEIKNLTYYKNQKKILLKELDTFKGLSPDHLEAAKQLQETERKYNEIRRKCIECHD